ncbi:MAG TPA: lycopene cyclase domain-containing protein [Acidobacteriaceae bacterium]
MRRILQTQSSAFYITAAMLAMLIVPAALTLHTVHMSALKPDVPPDASPYGYTVSLLLFIVPSLSVILWFLPQEGLRISQRAFAWTIGILFPLGALLDFFFAQYFFRFPNAKSTLGIGAPALGGTVPIEEYAFYLTGFMAVVLLYIWLDEYWLAAYSVPGNAEKRTTFERLLRFHPKSLLLAAGLIAAAILYEKLVVRIPGRFPGYFMFLVLFALLPSSALLPTARPVINWRALSLTMFILLLTSLLWEVTLALPYGWWNFQDKEMLGIRITAWSFLPIEEVFVWIAVTYASVIVYEIVKRWKGSGRAARHAFLGPRNAADKAK